MTKSSFADNPPPALGAFNEDRETLADVEDNGWKARELRARCGYLSGNEGFPERTFEEDFGLELDKVQLRRRPCDGFTLQSENAERFERENPNYFPFVYQYPRRDTKLTENLDQISHLAVSEFGQLDYLHPLASVIQVVRPDPRIPFITRCWDFEQRPGAIIKTARFQLPDGEQIEGSCICYEPPTAQELQENFNNYLIFRNVVGHEIGHYCWETHGRERCGTVWDELEGTGEELAKVLREQVVSLFSIFLIMYRGFWERHRLTRDEVGEAFEKLRFESRSAAENQGRILDAIVGLEFPRREFPPHDLELPAGRSDSDAAVQLSEDAIYEIRDAARAIVHEAAPIPFASTAAVIALRKIDNFISFRFVDDDELPRWTAVDRSARHVDPVTEFPSQWREYQLGIPRCDGDQPPLGHYLEVARQLAHIRLYGDRFGKSLDFMKSEDVERVCDAEGRDLARILALALYAQDGVKARRRLTTQLAEMLLHHDPSELRYLVPHAANHFQWCTEDPDCPAADERFLAEIREVGDEEVHLTFWGEDGQRFRASLPHRTFLANGFAREEIYPGTPLKLFGLDEGEGPELRPVSLTRSEGSSSHRREERGAAAAAEVA